MTKIKIFLYVDQSATPHPYATTDRRGRIPEHVKEFVLEATIGETFEISNVKLEEKAS